MKPRSAPSTLLLADSAADSATLPRIRVVLVGTSHPGNVGAVARAMKTMGLTRLALVTPRYAEVTTHPDALAFASGAGDLLAAATLHDHLPAALTDCTWAVALTARTREYTPLELDARAAAARAVAVLAEPGAEVALVFGSERYGLSNDDVLACQACCTIPTSAAYSSLNLAQAVQILAYECRLAALAAHAPVVAAMPDPPPAVDTPNEPTATVEEREQMFAHLQTALVDIGFLDPAAPKKLMERLRRMLSHAPLSRPEVNILRGICRNILARRGARAPGDCHDSRDSRGSQVDPPAGP